MNRVVVASACVVLGATHAFAASTPGRFAVDAKTETVLDHATGRTWQRAQAVGTFSWSGAQDWCKQLALAGGGWRVPTLVELEGLVDRAAKDPAIDTAVFGPTTAESFWTVTPALTAASAWSVHFGPGNSAVTAKSALHRLRCVR
ncbi:MAG: DUF1566 domain-containing protein [Deltaproteobacteria bacterium]|nr:DUF1566 domain-containing protein [Deltaproteobacteria bacterium]